MGWKSHWKKNVLYYTIHRAAWYVLTAKTLLLSLWLAYFGVQFMYVITPWATLRRQISHRRMDIEMCWVPTPVMTTYRHNLALKLGAVLKP
jgi:hypothetical protein